MIAFALIALVVAQDAPPADAPSASPEAPPADAPPADAPPEAPPEAPLVFDDGSFDDGMSYYNRFEFEKASFRFRAATRSQDKPAPEVARAYLWLGLALAQAGDEIGAREAFVEAIALDKNVVLPMDAPPNLRPIFDDAYAHPRAPQKGSDAPVADVKKSDDAMPVTTIVGAAVAGGGVLAFAGGAIAGAVAVSQADAANQERFQDDALAAHEQAAGTALVANALLVTGAAASVAGAAVVVAGAFLE